MPWTDAFIPAEVKYHNDVMKATWGHLAPSKNRNYSGSIVYALGIYGSDHLNPTVLKCDFRRLGDSPWFFDAMIDFLQQQRGKAGCIYRFVGNFKNYEFSGTVQQLRVGPRTTQGGRGVL